MIRAEDAVEHDVLSAHRQSSALRHRIARIDREIQNGILELTRIHSRQPKIGRADHADFDRVAQASLQEIGQAHELTIQIDDRRIQNLSARKCQQALR